MLPLIGRVCLPAAGGKTLPYKNEMMAGRSKSGFTPHQSSRRICNGQGQTAVRRLRLVGVHQRGLFAGIGAGFTLLEITISVAIMVLIVTVVFPQIGDIAKVQLHTSARRLGGTIRHSCFTAAMTKKRYWLSYNLDKQEYWLSEAVPDPEHPGYDKPVELKRGPGRRRKLAEGIKFSAVELADGSERTTGEASTEFYLGRSGHTIIELHDQKNRVWCVEVLPYGCRLPKMGPC